MTQETDIATLKSEGRDIVRRLEGIEETLYGNGHPGMKSTLELVAHEVKGIGSKLERMDFDAQKKADVSWQVKLLILGAIVGPLATVLIERLTR